MQYSQKNFMRTGNDQKNNGQNFWEILERIIGKISSIIGAGLILAEMVRYRCDRRTDSFSALYSRLADVPALLCR